MPGVVERAVTPPVVTRLGNKYPGTGTHGKEAILFLPPGMALLAALD
jgi:hypothetical protein